MSILLFAVVLFSQCQKSPNEEILDPAFQSSEVGTVAATSALSSAQVFITLDVTKSVKVSGNSYVLYQNLNTPGDNSDYPNRSLVRIFENGVEIGPAHSKHSDIQTSGNGRFSHWNSDLYFSASDNSDPRTNGKKYTYTTETGTVTEPTPTVTPSSSVQSSALEVNKAVKVSGYAYVLYQNLNTPGDDSTYPNRSLVRIFENGVEIGPAHSKHADIQTYGKGRFSHWNSDLYFSASDNTDPRTNGRKYTFTIESGTVSQPAPAPTPTSTPTPTPSSSEGLVGYATVDGMTTGGQGGQTVTVSTLSALSSAVSSTSPMIIYVSGTITGTGSVQVRSNKTIIGLSGATLNGVGIKIYEMSNVIIRNLKIQNVVAGSDDNDAINIKYSHHIWIDHCELSADRTHGWEYWDGLLDITRESNYITVSWTKFHDSHIANLVGGGIAGHESDRGKLKVTYHHNYFYNISERAPDMKYGTVHMFNNYHLNNSGYSVASQLGGTLRTDNNYFSNCSIPITTSINGAAPGYVSGANTNTFVNSGSVRISTAASSWVPTYEYKSIMHATADVPSVVTSGAGPK